MRLNSDPNFTNFILTFFSIVFGLVAAEYVVGWQVFLRRLRANPALSFHINFVMASVLGFLLLVQNWWALWSYRDPLAGSFPIALLIVLNPILLQFGAAFLFPDPELRSEDDYGLGFFTRQRWAFVPIALLLLKLSIDPTLLDPNRFPLLRSPDNLYRVTGAGLLVTAAILQDKWKGAQTALLLAMLALFVMFLIR